ncbi:hypothetical protein MHK_003905, partial [Candidatus Magnetomorum sp. HK-1]
QSNGKNITTQFHVLVNPINDAPVAENVNFVSNEDQLLSGRLNANDLENDSLTFKLISQAGKGQITLVNAATGDFVYMPYLNQNGSDSFLFSASDQEYSSNSAIAQITIQPVNDPPQGGNFNVEGHENTDLFFTSSQFNTVFTDIDGDNLQKIRITQLPSKGSLLLNNNEVATNSTLLVEHLSTLSFKPDLDWAGSTFFTYKAGDTNSWSIESSQVSITIIADPPDIGTIVKTCIEDERLDFDSSDLSSFVLNSTSYIRIESPPEHGDLLFDEIKPDENHVFDGQKISAGFEIHIAKLIAGELVYIPNENFNGLDLFLWRASKNGIWSDEAMVKINVSPVNDAPEINSIEKTDFEDSIIAFNQTDFTAAFNDIENDSLSYISFISLPDPVMGQLRIENQSIETNTEINASQLNQL